MYVRQVYFQRMKIKKKRRDISRLEFVIIGCLGCNAIRKLWQFSANYNRLLKMLGQFIAPSDYYYLMSFVGSGWHCFPFLESKNASVHEKRVGINKQEEDVKIEITVTGNKTDDYRCLMMAVESVLRHPHLLLTWYMLVAWELLDNWKIHK